MSIQATIYAGYGIAASVLGVPCQQYRPTGPNNLVATPIATLQAAFDTRPDFSFKAPSLYAKPQWYGLFDASTVQVGDYIIHPTLGTFFVASLEPLHSPLLNSCNRTISVMRPNPASGAGFVSDYGGDNPADELPILTAWPVSLLTKSRGERGDTNLPGDTRIPWVEVLMPALSGYAVKFSDVVCDEAGTRYIKRGFKVIRNLTLCSKCATTFKNSMNTIAKLVVNHSKSHYFSCICQSSRMVNGAGEGLSNLYLDEVS